MYTGSYDEYLPVLCSQLKLFREALRDIDIFHLDFITALSYRSAPWQPKMESRVPTSLPNIHTAECAKYTRAVIKWLFV